MGRCPTSSGPAGCSSCLPSATEAWSPAGRCPPRPRERGPSQQGSGSAGPIDPVAVWLTSRVDQGSSLPSRRQSLEGTDLDGNAVILSVSVAKKLYRCPECRGYIDVGSEHVVVRYPSGEESWHQHWHRRCASELVRRELRSLHPVAASGSTSSKGQRRRAALQRRQRK